MRPILLVLLCLPTSFVIASSPGSATPSTIFVDSFEGVWPQAPWGATDWPWEITDRCGVSDGSWALVKADTGWLNPDRHFWVGPLALPAGAVMVTIEFSFAVCNDDLGEFRVASFSGSRQVDLAGTSTRSTTLIRRSLALDVEGSDVTLDLRSNSGLVLDGIRIDAILPGPPGKPTLHGAYSGPRAGEISLYWSAPPPVLGHEPTGYRVYGAPGEAGFRLVGEAVVGEFRHTGLADGERWTYFITAFNAQGEGPASDFVTGRAGSLPSAPRDLRAVSQDPLSITLEWREPEATGGLSFSYGVYRASGDASFVRILGTQQNQVVDRVTPGQAYRYRVVAENAVGAGPPSGEVCLAPVGTFVLLSAPCPRTGWVAREHHEQRVDTPEEGSDPPPFEVDILEVHGHRRDSASYSADVTVAGTAAPTVSFLDGGLLFDFEADLLRGDVGFLGVGGNSAAVTLGSFGTPQPLCAVQVGSTCIPVPGNPTDPSWIAREGSGGYAVLVVESEGELPAKLTVSTPLLGETAATVLP